MSPPSPPRVLPALVALLVVMVPVAGAAGTAGAAAAQADRNCEVTPAAVQPLVDEYNGNVDRAPGLLRGQLSGQRIDLQLRTGDGVQRFGVVTDDEARVTGFTEGELDDPSLRVKANQSTVCEALAAEDPGSVLVEAYDAGEVTMDGVGLFNGVKTSLIKAGISVARSLDLL